MMMSKPNNDTEEAPPAAPLPAALNVGSIADLERRLAEMGSPNKASPPPVAAPAPVTRERAPVTAAAPMALKGGKNALLARIMAAKEKQHKKTTPPPPLPAPVAPPPTTDLLTDFDAPSTENDLPPPAYETNFLKDVPPPAFDVMEQQQQQQQQQMQMEFPPPPPIDSVIPPPPPLNDILPPPMPEDGFFDMGMPSAPTATAPMFEDLHTQQPPPQEFHPPPLPPPMEAASPELDIDSSILNALEPAEREAFLEEQRKILDQITRENSSANASASASASATAFDQRSSAYVANVAASYERGGRSQTSTSRSSGTSRPSSSSGPMVNLGGGSGEVAVRGSEETQKAIDDGTAVIVKCMSCDQWMQVTEAAELMFCPICQCVCPVEKKGAATTANMEAAAQLAADAELAEKLQQEEYTGAEQRRSRPAGRSGSDSRTQSSQQQSAEAGQTWYDWLTTTPSPAPATRPAPTSGVSSRSRGGGLVSAQTGEEARSYDESVGLMSGSGGGARVAEPSKSMFSCVADSMNTAVTQMYTIQADDEGNVHGVDSEGLLAMPDVSRQREN